MQNGFRQRISPIANNSNVSGDTVSAAAFVTFLTTIYSFGSVLKYIPSIGWMFVYGTILLVFAIIYASIMTNYKRSSINKFDLGVFTVINFFVPYSLLLDNQPLEIASDYIRLCILIGSLIYWSGKQIKEDLFFKILSKNLFILCIAFMVTKEIGELTVFQREIAIDTPVLVLLFCITLWRKEWIKSTLTVVMIFMTGKEAGIIAAVSYTHLTLPTKA